MKNALYSCTVVLAYAKWTVCNCNLHRVDKSLTPYSMHIRHPLTIARKSLKCETDKRTDGLVNPLLAVTATVLAFLLRPVTSYSMICHNERNTYTRVYIYLSLPAYTNALIYIHMYMYTRWIRNRAADGGYWGAFVLVSP